MNIRIRNTAFSAFLLFCCSAFVAAASPDLSRIMPRGGQRGTEVEVQFRGNRLDDAQEIMFYSPGFEVLELKAEKDNRVVVKLRIKDDCALGEHLMRVRTAGGITDAQTFFVGPYPAVDEKEPNSEFATPQQIPINSTVHGVVENEDVDYYLVEAKKGQRISAEVEGIRLGVTMFDPYVAIMDMKRFELAANDDSALHLQDPVASVIAPEGGTYVIQVRESSYGGDGNSLYRLHVGNFPRPHVVYPPGGQVGQELEVKYIGDVAGDFTEKVKLPAKAVGKHPLFAHRDGQSTTSPNYIRVSDYPNVNEVEPNDGRNDATATDQTVPLAFNGIIEKDGDFDWFRFKAKKGQQFNVRCYARDLRSPLDAVLYLYRADNGDRINVEDDSGGPDPSIRFNVPADGEYIVGVRDHLRKGGPRYIYRIEFEPITPTLTTGIPEYRRYSQERNNIPVPRGNRYATIIRVNRDNFGGDVVLSAPQLPKGMTMHADTMAQNISEMPVVFEAAPDAPLGGTLMPLDGAHADSSKGITGGFAQEIGLVYGNPNRRTYYAAHTDRVAAAVTGEVPFKIRIVEPKAPLVRNGSMNLKVVAERKDGFDGPITLRMLWRPPGIGASGSVQIEKGQTEAEYPINANGNAPTQTWKIAIVANANAGKGTVWVSTQLAPLTVAEPFVSMDIQMAAAEQGQPADLICKLNQHHPFEGKAKVILHGLPAKVTAETREQEITKDDQEITFKLKTDEKTPAGQHKSLFCQVIVTQHGEPVVHSVGGGGTLRVDPPPPPKKDEPKVAAKPKEDKPKPQPKEEKPAEKQLSRLEKLRLEAQQRAEEAANQQ